MRFPKSIDLATRLTREGRLTEALSALGGVAFEVAPQAAQALRRAGRGPTVDAGLRAALENGLSALGRFGTPVRRDGVGATREGVNDANFTEHHLDGTIGALTYKLYRPASAGAGPLPLVVMLHGCTQSPDDFASGTRMNILAERENFFVAYPAQSRAANAQRCWNWFRAADQGRAGEPARIVAMVNEIAAMHAIDADRVYVAGLSAGGAAAAVLGQGYPEVFAAVGVHSGLACGAAADLASALAAMRNGAAAARTGGSMPTIVFHGDRDGTVAPINGAQVLAQAEPSRPLDTTVETGHAPGGQPYTRTVQNDAAGRPWAEHWVLHGAGHAWSGGDPAGSYTDPRGPDASAAMLRFFRHQTRGR